MTNQQILEKAITKAIDGGWLPYFAGFDKQMNAKTIRFIISEGAQDVVRFDVVTKGRIYGVSGYSLDIATIIFNHDFAMALWGAGNTVRIPEFDDEDFDHYLGHEMHEGNEAWQFYLQQMVIAEDPIQYLGDNL